MSEIICEKCGRQQPGTSALQQCVYCGAALPAPEAAAAPLPPEPVAEVAAEAPAETPVAASDPVPEGKRRCGNCGEILYAEESRCWRCGADQAATTAPTPPPVAALPSDQPALPPADDAPLPAQTPMPPTPPFVPSTVAAPSVDPAAQNLGIWAFVLSLLGMISCPPLVPSIIAIVLGARARRLGDSPLGLAAIIIGCIGLVIYTILITLMVIGLIVSKNPDGTTGTSLLWSLQCLNS